MKHDLPIMLVAVAALAMAYVTATKQLVVDNHLDRLDAAFKLSTPKERTHIASD